MAEMAKLLELLTQGGLLTGLILILYGGYKEWWVFGTWHREKITELKATLAETQKRETEWKELFFESKNITRRAITMAAQQSPLQDGG